MKPNPSPPLSLNRSGLACFWSIKALIEQRAWVYLWTLTLPTLMPDYYIAACRVRLLNMMATARKQGEFPVFGGVRVTEVHPGGHGLHDHWPMTWGNRLVTDGRDVKRFWAMAHEAGFGRLSCHPESTTPRLAALNAARTSKPDALAS